MDTALTILGLGTIAALVYGVSLGREKRKQTASPEGLIASMKAHADPGTGVVLVNGVINNPGIVTSDYEITIFVSQRDGWSVEYSVNLRGIAPGAQGPFNLRTRSLNFGTSDIVNVRAVLYSSTGSPLDRASSTTTAGAPGARPTKESATMKWWEREPEGGWTRPRNRVERTPQSTVRISKQLETSGASAVGASNSISPNRLFGRSGLAS